MSTTEHEDRDGGDVLTPVGTLLARIRAPEPWTEDERTAALDELFHEGVDRVPYLKRFVALLVLSTAIATFGLLADSVAVVIGAMLVAPLMTPILATSAAVVYGQPRRLATSVAVVLLGTTAAVCVSFAISWLAPGAFTAAQLSQQVVSRTEPGLLDLGIAIAAGLAAGYVLAHRTAGASLPGVAISVALVPPLAAVGISAWLGEYGDARGAMLLFLTNFVAIVLSAGAVLVVSGFVPPHIRQMAKGRLTAGLGVTLFALGLIVVPLALHTAQEIREQEVERTALDTVHDWDETATVQSIDVATSGGRADIDIEVVITGQKQPAWVLAELISENTGINVDLRVAYESEVIEAASTR